MGGLLGNSAPSLSLADCSCGLSDAIASSMANVRILERIPASGNPPSGIPFSLKVEIQTFVTGSQTIFRTPFSCLDAFIAVRGTEKHDNRILGGTFIRTSAFSNCKGEGIIRFDRSFRPGPEDWVRLELYPGGSVELFQSETTLEDVREGRIRPVAVSDRIRFSESQATLKNAGIIQEPVEPFSALTAGFGTINKTIFGLTALAAVGVGGFFLVKSSLISSGLKKVLP